MREVIWWGGLGWLGNEFLGNVSLFVGYIKIFIDILILLLLFCCFDFKVVLLVGML